MRPVFSVLIPALLWAVTLWRAPSAFRAPSSPASRALWATLATMALGLSTRPPVIARFMESATGVPEVSVLVKHLLGLAAATFLLDYVYAIHGRPGQLVGSARLRHRLALVAGLVLAVLFIGFFKHDAIVPDSIDAYYGDPVVQLYLAVYYLFLGVATALAAHLFWTNRLDVPRGLLRTGVRLLAAGCAVGFGYTVYRVAFIARHGNAPIDPVTGRPIPVDDAVAELLPAVGALLLVLGISMPPLRIALRYVRDQSAMWRLHPLWSDLVHAVPHVVFGSPRGRVRALFAYGDRSLDLAHRAFEIRDAALALRDTVPAPPGPVPAGGPAGPAGSAGCIALDERAGARAEAEWLRAALHHQAHGRPPVGGMPPEPDHPPCLTPREEIAWLLQVAAAYRRPAAGHRA
ncbi:MAB_1171c family putative transporter [Kitasatospora sp. NPDC093806]|uniref:MAB_1171c family putative transporter n=1 Tax=Kitasatospora sp. NPDC093806 TaxID=3155075 RepID=UPI00341CF42D